MTNPVIDQHGEDLARRYASRAAALASERASWEPVWRDIREFILPRTARFQGETANKGDRQDKSIINCQPRFAFRTLAAGMQSGMTSPMRPWFRLGVPDPDLNRFKAVKIWLDEVESVIRAILRKSNQYDMLKSTYLSSGGYGTGLIWLDDDPDDVIRAHSFSVGGYALGADPSGRIDTVYRDGSLSVANWIRRFGERCPQRVKDLYDRGSYDVCLPILHVGEPNSFHRPYSALGRYKGWASVWIDPSQRGKEAILSYGGYDYNPGLAMRWDVQFEDVYGTGCGEIALGDVRQLQHTERRSLQLLDRHYDPNMLVDSSLANAASSLLPGQSTFQNGLIAMGNPAARPAYQIDNPRFDLIEGKQRQVEERIDEAAYKQLFLMIAELADQPNITATQINSMREEKLAQLSPVVERANDELLDPLIEINFLKAQTRGMIPPPPEEIQGMPLKIEYISVMAQAHKALGLGNIERFIGFVGNFAQIKPEALDKIDARRVVDEYADGAGVSPKIVLTDEEADQITQARNSAQMQQMGVEQGVQMAQMAKTLSETPAGAGASALTRAMETAGVG